MSRAGWASPPTVAADASSAPRLAGLIGAALAVARIDGSQPMADMLGLAYSFAQPARCRRMSKARSRCRSRSPTPRARRSWRSIWPGGLTGPHDALEGPFGYFRAVRRRRAGALYGGLGTRGGSRRSARSPIRPAAPATRASARCRGSGGRCGQADRSASSAADRRLVGRPYRARDDARPMRGCACRCCRADADRRTHRPAPLHARDVRRPALIALAGHADHRRSTAIPIPTRCCRSGCSDADGRRVHDIPHTLGSPEAPLSAEQAAAKHDLARELAPEPRPPHFRRSTELFHGAGT